jgi:hypothetical protein
MAQIMNTVFGIGIAVILFIVVLLGINVFYPGPNWEDYNCTEPKMVEMQVCNPDMSVGDCYKIVAGTQLNDSATQQEKAFEDCNKRFMHDNDIYGKNFLLITNIIGVIIIVLSLLLFLHLPTMINLSAGTAFAGLVLIFAGFIRGWSSTNDKVKFLIALIIAAVIIVFAIIINKKYSKTKRRK